MESVLELDDYKLFSSIVKPKNDKEKLEIQQQQAFTALHST